MANFCSGERSVLEINFHQKNDGRSSLNSLSVDCKGLNQTKIAGSDSALVCYSLFSDLSSTNFPSLIGCYLSTYKDVASSRGIVIISSWDLSIVDRIRPQSGFAGADSGIQNA